MVLQLERTTTWSSPLLNLMASLQALKVFVYRTFSKLLPACQRQLSSKIEDHQVKVLFDHSSSPANCARLLSVSSPHALAWLSVMPTPQQNLHLDSPEFQVALKWWLGMDTSQNSSCLFCPMHTLDPQGHHALTCKSGGDSIFRHKSLLGIM